MADESRTPDAIFYPAGWKPKGFKNPRPGNRLHNWLVDVLKSAQVYHHAVPGGWTLAVGTLGETQFHPTGHPRHGQPRYDRERQDRGPAEGCDFAYLQPAQEGDDD